jgi:hypothetical protein
VGGVKLVEVVVVAWTVAVVEVAGVVVAVVEVAAAAGAVALVAGVAVTVVALFTSVPSNVISVPLRSPEVNASALAVEPANVAKSAAILLETLASPRVGASESITRVCVASVVNSVSAA